jgi:8-amino-7-oxononanoate synthase
MENFPESLVKKLQTRQDASALRTLAEYDSLIDFSSNDYLGFSRNSIISANTHLILGQNFYNGATGSRLISGNHWLYKQAERLISGYHNAESSLIFNSGYDANIGFFSSVPQKDDIVLYDEFIHASIRDGIRLGNAKAYKFGHNSIENLRQLLHKFRETATEVYVVTESVFSMDGDSPNLSEMGKLCRKFSCRLIVDEAHAAGVFGSGLATDSDCFARIVTFGKAIGCHGAAILGSKILREYLVNFARSFIYTTALPPHSVAAIIAAYNFLATEAEAGRNQLFSNVASFKKLIVENSLQSFFISSQSAIQCAIIAGNKNVRNIAANLQQQGFDVRAILSPTIPAGQERLRFCLHSYNTNDEITVVLQQLTLYLR